MLEDRYEQFHEKSGGERSDTGSSDCALLVESRILDRLVAVS